MGVDEHALTAELAVMSLATYCGASVNCTAETAHLTTITLVSRPSSLRAVQNNRRAFGYSLVCQTISHDA